MTNLIIIDNSIYKKSETGEWLLSGNVVDGADISYINWYN